MRQAECIRYVDDPNCEGLRNFGDDGNRPSAGHFTEKATLREEQTALSLPNVCPGIRVYREEFVPPLSRARAAENTVRIRDTPDKAQSRSGANCPTNL